jgi:hypothetical protein
MTGICTLRWSLVLGGLATGTAWADPAPQSPYEDGYGHAGTIAVGVAAGATLASDVRDVSVTPRIGWFVAERFEVAATASLARLDTGAQAATLWSMLAEPAYHLAVADRTFAVLGMGVGAAYVHELGTGLAVAPRVGLEFVVGRALVITPALAYTYVAHRALDAGDVAVAGVTGALRLQLGVAATW